jgi:hypothetical protein
LRYAGEFGGFRVAAGIGYQEQDIGASGSCVGVAPNGFPCGIDAANPYSRGESEWAGSLAVMHVATGLFAQGHYAASEFYGGSDGNIWLVQAGITKNWFGLGNTSFYGEYARAQDLNSNTVATSGDTSDVRFYGVGVVQQIDAAAMEVFLGWRRFETEVNNVSNDDLDIVHGGARVRF